MADLGNIDDLLLGAGTSTQPQTPEHQSEVGYGDPVDDTNIEPEPDATDNNPDGVDPGSEEEREEKENASDNLDEYGNPKSPDNEVIRGRLKQQARKYEAEIESLRAQLAQQGASRQVQQAANNFEYDPNQEGNWQQQLESVIKQTVRSMHTEEQQRYQRVKEQEIQAQFEKKFHEGMSNFDDFVEVVSAQPITDAMTAATRGMQDPAAFLYAASRRAPDELARISKIPDAYTQVMEMGKLEERMRKTKASTQAPKPIGRVKEDSTIPYKTDKKEPIEDLIAKSDAKRRAQFQARRR